MLKSRSIISQKHEGGYRAKGSLYPRVIMLTTKSGALRVDFQKSTAALNRPLTPQLVVKELNSSRFPENKQEKSNSTRCPYKASEPESTSSQARRDSLRVTQQICNRRHSNDPAPRTRLQNKPRQKIKVLYAMAFTDPKNEY